MESKLNAMIVVLVMVIFLQVLIKAILVLLRSAKATR